MVIARATFAQNAASAMVETLLAISEPMSDAIRRTKANAANVCIRPGLDRSEDRNRRTAPNVCRCLRLLLTSGWCKPNMFGVRAE